MCACVWCGNVGPLNRSHSVGAAVPHVLLSRFLSVFSCPSRVRWKERKIPTSWLKAEVKRTQKVSAMLQPEGIRKEVCLIYVGYSETLSQFHCENAQRVPFCADCSIETLKHMKHITPKQVSHMVSVRVCACACVCVCLCVCVCVCV